MRKITFLLVCFAIVSFAKVNKDYGSVEVNEVTSIYDGDTFRVNIESFPDIVGQKMAIRVSGVDTPEMKGKCKKEIELARAAKKFTVNFLRNAKRVELRNMQRGKYFRIVADVYGDNISLAELLIKNDLAVPYFGNKKIKDWCEQ